MHPVTWVGYDTKYIQEIRLGGGLYMAQYMMATDLPTYLSYLLSRYIPN